MEPKVIRTQEQYQDYLQEVQVLISKVPEIGSKSAERLELLTVLLEAYESNKFPIELPDPIDAILFRMQERGLKQADLIPYFGTSSRVSEVLKRKRPMTVQMIRAISLGLGISTDTLIGLTMPDELPQKTEVDWSKFPVQEMFRRGWINHFSEKTKAGIEDVVRTFILDSGIQFGTAAFRRTLSGEAQSPSTRYALYAWLARVIQRAREKKARLRKFDSDVLSASFLRDLSQLSWLDSGPLLAIEYLEKHGIAVVIEPHLKGTHLDGAALKDSDGTPIIGLTLRYDRLDNFWFTLLHEVAHIWKHVTVNETFLDDLDASSEDRREAEANRLAKEASIPRLIWKRSDAFISPSKESIERLSRELKIHPAIIAGRLRRETGNFRQFGDLLGQDQVRSLLLPAAFECEAQE
jgi:HTH-type transcriptional regulator / antitoxin HigA